LKFTRCPHSLAATLTPLPSMSLIPFAPFSTRPLPTSKKLASSPSNHRQSQASRTGASPCSAGAIGSALTAPLPNSSTADCLPRLNGNKRASLETACPHAVKSTNERKNGCGQAASRISPLSLKPTRSACCLATISRLTSHGVDSFCGGAECSTRAQRSIYIWENPKYSLEPRSFENRAQSLLQTSQEKLPAIRFNLLHGQNKRRHPCYR
jgi:hypothetical protein